MSSKDKLDPRKGQQHRDMGIPQVGSEPQPGATTPPVPRHYSPTTPPVPRQRTPDPRKVDDVPVKRTRRSRKATTGGKFDTGRG